MIDNFIVKAIAHKLRFLTKTYIDGYILDKTRMLVYPKISLLRF